MVPTTSSSWSWSSPEEVTRHRKNKHTHAAVLTIKPSDRDRGAERTCGPVRARGTTDTNFGGAREALVISSARGYGLPMAGGGVSTTSGSDPHSGVLGHRRRRICKLGFFSY